MDELRIEMTISEVLNWIISRHVGDQLKPRNRTPGADIDIIIIIYIII